MEKTKFTIDQLESLSGLTKRTIRYYIQKELVLRPEGETKNSYYTSEHLDSLISVKKLSSAGISLSKIKEILDGDSYIPKEVKFKKQGQFSIKSHIHIDEGVELVVDSSVSSLSVTELRSLVKKILKQIGDKNGK